MKKPFENNYSITVAYAEDHEMVRQGVSEILEKSGIQVIIKATDGRELLTSLEQTKRNVDIAHCRES